MLPVVHCFDFEILLILGGATQSKRFCIGNKAVCVGDTLNISRICSLLQDQTRKSHRFECLVDYNISVFGIQFLFAGIVAEAFRNCSTQSQMSKQRMDTAYLDITRQFSLDSFRINTKVAAQAAYLLYPESAVFDLFLINQHDFYFRSISDCAKAYTQMYLPLDYAVDRQAGS